MDATFGDTGVEPPGFERPGVERNWAVRRSPSSLVGGVITAMLISTLFLTRLALTLGHSELSLALVVVLGGMTVLVLTGAVRISPTRAILFSVSIAFLLLSLMFGNSTQISYTSFANLILLYACWMFIVPDDRQFFSTLVTVRRMLLFIAACGIVQFVAQIAIKDPFLFNWQGLLPPQLLSRGFNYMIPIPGLGLNKSNGFFLLEPSSLSQMMAIAIIIELEFFRPSWRLVVLATAMSLAFSGTGLVLFALIVPLMLLSRGRGGLLLVLVPALIAAGALLAGPRIALLLDRVQEFGSTQSSGFARFLSPFYLFNDYLYPEVASTLFGMGPGSIETYALKTAYLFHDPTWGKLIFEYGFLGAVPFACFVCHCFFAGARSSWLAAALFLNYVLLGGNLVDARLHILILALIVLQNRPRDVAGALTTSHGSSCRWVHAPPMA